MSASDGVTLTYTSARRLDTDHAAYLAHGGIVLDLREPTFARGAPIMVRIEAPGGRVFDLAGVVSRTMPGQGLGVDFEAGVLEDLDRYVLSDEFRRLRATDPEPLGPAPSVRYAPLLTESDSDPDLGRARRRSPATPETLTLPPASTTVSNRARRPHPTRGLSPPEAIADDTARREPEASIEPSKPAPAAASVPKASMEDAPTAPEGERPSPGDSGAAVAEPPPPSSVVIRPPEPGEEFFVFVMKFPTITSFVEVADTLQATSTVSVPLEDDKLTPAGAVAQLRLTLPGRNIFEMWGVVLEVGAESVRVAVSAQDDTLRKALLHPGTIASRKRLEREAEQAPEPVTALRIRQEKPKEDVERMPIRRRLARMGMDDKINLALSGGREERMALAMDGNKAVHHYLLKNAKITLDEIALMARLPSLNPDVLDKIAENPAYTQNPTITKALVYNPRTPVRTAIRLLDRLPRSEVMNLAKRSSMNARLVMAAKKKIERRSR